MNTDFFGTIDRTSYFSSLNAGVKLIVSFALIIAALIVRDPLTSGILFALELLGFILVGFRPVNVLARFWPILIAVITTGWSVAMLSAKTGDGLDDLTKQLATHLPEGPKYFPDDMMTDQPERLICAELIREKALQHLRDEVPHGIGVEMMGMEKMNDNFMEINATIYCERDAHKGIIIGKHGAMLQTIGSEAREDIEKLLGLHVNLKLWVKVRPDWRNRASDLRTLGYDAK